MTAKLRIRKKTAFSYKTFEACSFVLYFCAPLINLVYRAFFKSLMGQNAITGLVIGTIYLPLIISLVASHWKNLKSDFILLLILVVAFFELSLTIHPEYEYWYRRSDFGVWHYVLIPTEGLYAYLFVRLINKPDKIIKYMKIAGWLMMIFFIYQSRTAMTRGYWYGIQSLNNRAEMDHSVSFGYNVMLFGLFFIYDALQHHKQADIIGAGVSILLILFCGTRGPVLFMTLFLVLYAIKYYLNSRKKLLFMVLGSAVIAIVYVFYEQIIGLFASFFSMIGINSRAIISILNGSFSNDSGRSRIWAMAIEMIQSNPWGYGAMGSQPVISRLIYCGYPHSIVFEMLIDFGVIIGSILLIVLFYNAISILFRKQYAPWNGVFLCFFGTSCQLFISLCFWSSPAFWSSIGIGVCCYLEHRKVRKRENRIGDESSQRNYA